MTEDESSDWENNHIFSDLNEQPATNPDTDTPLLDIVPVTKGPYNSAECCLGEVLRLMDPEETNEDSNLPKILKLGAPITSETIGASLPGGLSGTIVELKNPDDVEDEAFVGAIFDHKDEIFIRWLTPKQFKVVE